MPNLFTITASTNSVRLDKKRTGEATFTVTNASGRPLRGRACLVAEDPTAQEWLTLEGEAEHEFPIGGTKQYVVSADVPSEAAPGSYRFRLDVLNVERPDEDYVEGPAVTFVVGEAEEEKAFPWWMVAVAAGVLVVGGLVAFLLWPDGEVTVPNVVGMTLEEADAKLAANDLQVGDTRDTISASGVVGEVLRSDPKAGAEAAPGSAVALVIQAETFTVPDVAGDPLPTAITKLRSNSLSLGTLRLQFSNTVEEDRVIGSDPGPGTKLRRDAPVNLAISRGRFTGPLIDPAVVIEDLREEYNLEPTVNVHIIDGFPGLDVGNENN